ncbi:hypothetical protein [Alteromonas sp. S005]|uniref:hypothetical protein n=1 Tax=Alteromonas sp. S005 TaxID=3117400 RepID=UPI002FE1CF7E
MDVTTKEEAEAVVALNKLERIQKIESQINRLSFIPALIFAVMLTLLFVYKFVMDSDIDAWTGLLLASANIAAIGQALVKRADLQYQLSKLKYEQ